jgi:hypothetical protein
MSGLKLLLAFYGLNSALLASMLPAQPATVQLVISVADQTGAVVGGAEVRLMQSSDMAQPVLFADRDGHLTLQVEPGQYDLSVSDPGFKMVKRYIEVTTDPNQSLSVLLKIGDTGSPIIGGHPKYPPKPPHVRNLPSPKDVPAECEDSEVALPPFLHDAGVPHFFPPHSGISYGVSFPIDSDEGPITHAQLESSVQFSCSLFADWNLDVWSASGQRMRDHREEKDHEVWPEHFSCGVNVLLRVHAHSCAVVTMIYNLRDLYTLSPGRYSIAERPGKGQPFTRPTARNGLNFSIGK